MPFEKYKGIGAEIQRLGIGLILVGGFIDIPHAIRSGGDTLFIWLVFVGLALTMVGLLAEYNTVE